jgi:hypothetical protein
MQQQRTENDIEFDRAAREGGDVRVVNVSPFDARFEIATVPGSPPRMIRLKPGESTLLQRGYTVETQSMASKNYKLPPAIEVNTMREAWPGKRSIKSGVETWHVQPGPRLPMVVSEFRAAEVKAQWEAAMMERSEAERAPMRLVMQRTDGTAVEVEAAVESVPAPRAKAGPVEDTGVVQIPDDDPEDMPTPTLPAAQAPAAPVKPEIKKAGR